MTMSDEQVERWRAKSRALRQSHFTFEGVMSQISLFMKYGYDQSDLRCRALPLSTLGGSHLLGNCLKDWSPRGVACRGGVRSKTKSVRPSENAYNTTACNKVEPNKTCAVACSTGYVLNPSKAKATTMQQYCPLSNYEPNGRPHGRIANDMCRGTCVTLHNSYCECENHRRSPYFRDVCSQVTRLPNITTPTCCSLRRLH